MIIFIYKAISFKCTFLGESEKVGNNADKVKRRTYK